MKVKCIKTFRDVQEGVTRSVGETFEVTTERFRAINATKYGQLVQEVRQRRRKPAETEE